jgi:predicted transcriptional regulator
MKQKKLLSTADAARLLGVTPAAVRLMITNRRLKVAAETEGGIHLFRRSDVEKLASRRELARRRRERAGQDGVELG